MEADVAAALLTAYGPAVGVVGFAAYGVAAWARRAWPTVPAWKLRALSVAVGLLGGALTWRTPDGALVGAVAGGCATAVVAAVRGHPQWPWRA